MQKVLKEKGTVMAGGEQRGINPIILEDGSRKGSRSGGGSCVGLRLAEVDDDGVQWLSIIDTKAARDPDNLIYEGLPRTTSGNAIIGRMSLPTMAARMRLAHEDAKVVEAEDDDRFAAFGAMVLGEMSVYFDGKELVAFGEGLLNGEFDGLGLSMANGELGDLLDPEVGRIGEAADMHVAS